MSRKEMFYAELCKVCNNLNVCGQQCLSCELDRVMNIYTERIVNDNKKMGELKDKLSVQGKLLSSGVVIPMETYSLMVEALKSFKEIGNRARICLEQIDKE